METGQYLLVCLLSAIPGPPSVTIQDAFMQLFPVDKTKCPTIDPIRDIAYELYTSENPLQADMINLGDDNALAQSHFDFYKPTVFFFHAFFESSSSDSAQIIKTAYLQRKDYNVILLQAPRMEAGPWYLTAARNTRVVGEYTARFIDYLVSRGMDINSVHLIGLSLGAQMAGVCGQNVKSGRIQRITGLDPAGPLFTKWPRSLKLDAADAEFVDIIHTDAGIFGYPRSIGHADFWPNKGQSPQPGCRIEEVKRRSPDAFLIEPLFCSHWRSYQFYAESVITPNSFLAVSCKNWGQFLRGECKDNPQVNMGINVSPDAKGNFYLETRDVSPFSLQSDVPRKQLQHFALPEPPKEQVPQIHLQEQVNNLQLQPDNLQLQQGDLQLQHGNLQMQHGNLQLKPDNLQLQHGNLQLQHGKNLQLQPDNLQLQHGNLQNNKLQIHVEPINIQLQPEHLQKYNEVAPQQQQMFNQHNNQQGLLMPGYSSTNHETQRTPNHPLQRYYYY